MSRSETDFPILGKGWPFPVRPARDGRLPLVGGPEKVRQSIWLILSTAPGERPMRPDFGCGMHELVFMPNSATLRAQVRAKVRQALTRYEPRVDVLKLDVLATDEQPNLLEIHIEYRLRSNNSTYNLVYPFFLTEGAG